MAKINNTAAYAISTPIVGDDIVIGSAGGAQGETKNFQMSDILTYIMTSSTLTLQDVCDNGSATSTGITVGGAVTMSAGATINGSGLAVNGSGGILVTDVAGITSAGGPVSGTALSTSGGLFVSGTSILGEIDSAGPADIADTLTLSLASGTGLQVDADVNVDGVITTNGITAGVSIPFRDSGGNIIANIDSSGFFNIPPTGKFKLRTGSPSSATDTGELGQIAVDADYIYVCTAANTWKRVAIATW